MKPNSTARRFRNEALYDAGEYLIAGLENQAEWWEHLGDAHRDYAALARAAESLQAELAACRKERDEVYAVNAANNYDRAIEAREALEDIVAMCEPERVPLPLLNSKVIRRAREVVS